MEERKKKKSTKYLLIGTLVLFLSILGASMAYYLARVSEEFGGKAAGTELAINVEKLSSNATGDLIPLDNDLETLQLAAAGYDDKGACVDINGYSVCQIYHITLTNNGSVPLTVNGTVTLSGQNVPNIDCARMSDATTVANNNSCMNGMFVSGDTLAANSSNDYYVMVYINNLDEPQTDSGAFNGTVTFTTEDGKQVKGRFTKPFNLVKHIEELYDLNGGTTENKIDKTEITNNNIQYNYSTNVGLMNDRLGGTTTSLDGGNIRYYGAEPNNYIDIGDKTEVPVEQGNWTLVMGNSLPFNDSDGCNEFMQNSEVSDEQIIEICSQAGCNYTTVEEFCAVSIIPPGEPILWRIIGVFDGTLRIRRDEALNGYASYDTSALDINNGYGINEWSQADIMKLLNPGFSNEEIGGSLYWNSEYGKCYNRNGYSNTTCDFTNSGLSDEAKENVIDQTLYLGGFNTKEVFSNQAYQIERGNNVIQNSSDGIARTLTWTGKVGLIYPSDFGYAADFSNSNCQGNLSTFTSCTENWMYKGFSHTISPWTENNSDILFVDFGSFRNGYGSGGIGGWPTLLLDSSVLAESGNGSKEHPYVLTS